MHQLTLTASQNVLMNHINKHSYQNMCLKFAPPARIRDLRQSCHWWVVASIMF